MITFIKRATRLLSASLAITSFIAATASAHDSIVNARDTILVPERTRMAFPKMELGVKHAAGQAAIDRLGMRLGEVAGWYGKSADALRKQLLSDSRVRIDGKGRMFVVEEMPAPLAAPRAAAKTALALGQLSPIDDTFRLHSRPSANRTIYLDFDGATLSNTAWNTNGVINAKPFDLDGNPASFSEDELQRIQFIWQRVAEDYAPFNVDVTTEAPSPDRLERSSSTDAVYGTTVLITHNAGVYDCTCGGIAYVGVFNDTSSYYKPALVFYNMLGNGDEKAVAEAISHEAGHNVGLSHDGTGDTPYYTGHSSDPVTGWAPIMGVGYYKPVVQFSRGEYAGANNTEDDFAVAQSHGLPLRPDDFGNTRFAAKALPASGIIDGVIERGRDVDVFFFNALAGPVTIALTPANRSADADLSLGLYNSAGKVVASSNPANQLSASVSYQIPATGTYYIRVRSTGLGNPTTTGYSSYGSVGNYRVTAAFTSAGAAPKPVLYASTTKTAAPAAITLGAGRSSDSDGTITRYLWSFGDGTFDRTGTLKTVTKTYAKPGSYVVRLTVVDNVGLWRTTQRTISVGTSAATAMVSSSDF